MNSNDYNFILSQGPIAKTKKIFVGGLASDTKVEDLQSYFETFGKVSLGSANRVHHIIPTRPWPFSLPDNGNLTTLPILRNHPLVRLPLDSGLKSSFYTITHSM